MAAKAIRAAERQYAARYQVVLLRWLHVRLNVVYCVLDRADFLGVVVGNFDVEGFLECHDQFDGVERIGAKILDEARFIDVCII